MPFFPDCYDEWGLYKITYDGDHKMYDMLYEGTEEQCRQYAYENYTDKQQTDIVADWWDEVFCCNPAPLDRDGEYLDKNPTIIDLVNAIVEWKNND